MACVKPGGQRGAKLSFGPRFQEPQSLWFFSAPPAHRQKGLEDSSATPVALQLSVSYCSPCSIPGIEVVPKIDKDRGCEYALKSERVLFSVYAVWVVSLAHGES